MAEPGSVKHRVFQLHFADHGGTRGNIRESIMEEVKELIEHPKTLFYSQRVFLITLEQVQNGQIYALNMDDAAYNIGSIGLQKDSEFLEVLNYYLLKEMESGLWWREYQEYHKHLHVNQQVGMIEPLPLAYNNVLFLFTCLLMGMVIATTLAVTEKMRRILSQPSPLNWRQKRTNNTYSVLQRTFQKARGSMIKKILFG